MVIRGLLAVYTFVVPVLPFAAAAVPILVLPVPTARLLALLFFPLLYPLFHLLTCGLLSLPFRHAIRNGRFQRSLDDPVYGPRRLHAFCWTSIYYSPFYAGYLASPALRGLLFRLFGYRKAPEFTLYPDTWVRDLPLLSIGRGAYLANKSTIGSNLALQDGRILVEGITIGESAMIGHLTMIAAGSTVGPAGQVLHGTACGARVAVREGVVVNPTCTLDHRSSIGERTIIGTASYIGLGARIGPDLTLPAGSNIPRRAVLKSQEEVDDYISSETAGLRRLRAELARNLADRLGE
jgi:carbonic anhydrase/acetyltransferase-like protein (isoleucine patch superfamily)